MLHEVLVETGRHVMLVGVSVGLATAIGVPLGVWLTWRPGWSRVVLGAASVLQTIPSLALFGFLIPVPWIGGIGVRTALVALTLYSLLPVLRNTVTGIAGVDPAIREAGRGMGMTDAQLLWRVELPLAASVIIAGVRVATVIRIGVMSEPAPMPVSPTRRPTPSPANVNPRFILPPLPTPFPTISTNITAFVGNARLKAVGLRPAG